MKRGRGRPPKASNKDASGAGPEDEREIEGLQKRRGRPPKTSLQVASDSAPEAGNSNAPGKKMVNRICDLDLVDEKELHTSLLQLPLKHEKEVQSLLEQYKKRYQHWAFSLKCGFNLLFYGFGSKRALLEDFASTALTDGAAVVVKGYLPSVNVKQVICTVAEALWESSTACCHSSKPKSQKGPPAKPVLLASMSQIELLNLLQTEAPPGRHVYVVIHSLDGPDIRSADTQRALAGLAACASVRMIASVDHACAALLWDKEAAHVRFNWQWAHAPTFAPYAAETALVPPVLGAKGAERSVRGALVVLRSLTPNARSAFRLLAEHQLAHGDEQGLPFQSLYTMCREKFLVSSEATLRSHLVEFRDHELVRTRKGPDGQDVLVVPLPDEALEKLLADMAV